MTNRRLFFYNGILLTMVGVAVRTVTLLFNAYVSRAVGAEGVGLFTLIGTVYGFAVTFATSGISLTMTRLVAGVIGEGREGEVLGILKSGVMYSLFFGVTASAALLFGAPFFARYILADLRTVASIRILSLSLVPIALSSVFSGYFVGVKRVTANAAAQVLSQVFRMVLTVSLIANLSSLGVEYACIALSLGSMLSELFFCTVSFVELVIDRRKKKYHSARGGGHRGAVVSMALPLAFSAYIRSLLLTVEHALIPNRLRHRGETGSEAISSYGTLHGMALPMILYPMSTLTSFSGLLVPEFAESEGAGAKARMSRIASESMNMTLTYSVAAAVLLYLFGEELGYAVYGSYHAGYYICLLSLVVPIMYLDHVTDSMLKGIGEHVYSMWVNISDSFLSVILVWFLIPRLGISGYALVIIIMEAYNFALSLIRLRTRVKFEINILSSVVLPGLAAVFAALMSKRLFCMNGSATGWQWLLLKAVFAVCLFVAALTVMRSLLPKKKRKA